MSADRQRLLIVTLGANLLGGFTSLVFAIGGASACALAWSYGLYWPLGTWCSFMFGFLCGAVFNTFVTERKTLLEKAGGKHGKEA